MGSISLHVLGDDPLDAVLSDLAARVVLAFQYEPFRSLAQEGVVCIREAFDRVLPVTRACGVYVGDHRGVMVQELRVLARVATALPRPKLRRFAEGLATLDEALRWYADVVEAEVRRG